MGEDGEMRRSGVGFNSLFCRGLSERRNRSSVTAMSSSNLDYFNENETLNRLFLFMAGLGPYESSRNRIVRLYAFTLFFSPLFVHQVTFRSFVFLKRFLFFLFFYFSFTLVTIVIFIDRW